MTIFDRRHRWGEPIHEGARITRVCRVCGLSKSYETVIPESLVNALLENIARENVYRLRYFFGPRP